jgi:hypothetical protein
MLSCSKTYISTVLYATKGEGLGVGSSSIDSHSISCVVMCTVL